MKGAVRVSLVLAACMLFFAVCWAQDENAETTDVKETAEVTIVTPTTEAGEGLDLYAVAELFKDAESVEGFEKALNDSANEINNLDLDEDGNVDYIRVVDHGKDNTHILVLQVALGENEYQDVATIEIERKSDEDVDLQVVGNEEIYGKDYVVEPVQSSTTVVVHVHRWPVIRIIFGPKYRPWRSRWGWKSYPVWWRPWRRLPSATYKARTVRWTKRAAFHHAKRKRIKRAHIYTARSSKLAVRKTRPPAAKPKGPAKQPVKQPARAPARAVKKPPAKAQPRKALPAKPDKKPGG